ncbi:hypothetical protein SAMN04488518_109207 [Pseudovibrio ascidiaceicola]|uniref:Uncharacterized protein n=1 Tax=Pseudovibrio ascidiaceicola TaxID=285279 RepID=A0A1I4CL10_9HYPH|nr:hypothetical protein SAMN04488518_109207 [Pseudovibrio ascidiaceicola]
MMLAKPILEVNKIGFANSEIGFVNRNTKFFRERVSGGFGERNLAKKKVWRSWGQLGVSGLYAVKLFVSGVRGSF